MPLISQREYARRRGLSHVAVQRAVRSGRIVLVGGKVDPETADRDWSANTDEGKQNSLARDGNLDPDGSNGTAVGYARARVARELYQAQRSKIDLDLKRGSLVRADEVRLAAFNLARKTRDQLTALPDRISVVLAAIDDPAEVHRLLEAEIESICEELSNDGQ